MSGFYPKRICVWARLWLLGALPMLSMAQPTVRVAKSYEDTVRVLVLYNSGATGQGFCAPQTRPVGTLTQQFTSQSLTGIPNIKVLKSETTQWADVQAAFGGGRLPHVIVHVNAGWESFSGPYITDILNRAADQAIGVVSVGDDAAAFADKVFGFTNVENVPAPMGDATQYKAAGTKLWISLDGKADTLPKPGVIRNTVDSLKVTRLDFKPYGSDAAGDYRCQADADKYTVLAQFRSKLAYLGYQRAFDGTDTIAGPKELQAIVTFQDEQRRGVALSFQPQFLANAKAAHQIVYDAVIYASFAHFYNLVVSTPFATPGTSTFASSVNVSLATATPDAEIHYTLDGKEPDVNSPTYVPGTPIFLIGTTTVKAIAYKTGWLESGIMTEKYTKAVKASTLEIADVNGNPLSGGYLTELNSAYTVRLNTTQAGVSAAAISEITLAGKDSDTLRLSNPENTGTQITFTGTVPLTIPGAGILNDGKTQAAAYDTLRATWKNPKDPADVAVLSVPIRPAPRQGVAYFSTKPDGSDSTDQFQGTETRIYLVVRDQLLPPGVTPKVTLNTTPKNGSGRASDTEILDLAVDPARPGVYIAAIDVSPLPTAAPGDKKLQLVLDDLIKATYTDPQDAEPPAIANAGYGVAPEIDGILRFTDKLGNPLPAGLFYSPAEGTLYLSYKDDWVTGQIAAKSVSLAIDNSIGRAPADAETFTIPLIVAKRSGSTAFWEGSIPLKDLPFPVPGNGTAEAYILGKAKATVVSHSKTGASAGAATADLLIAYANQDAQVAIEGGKGPAFELSRADSIVILTVKDQTLSSGKDTIRVSLSCTGTLDGLEVLLVEQDGAPGTYVSLPVPKREGAAATDGTLQCKSRDYVKAVYIDPVYGARKEIQVLLDNPVATRIQYLINPFDSVSVNSVFEGQTNAFYAVITARSPDAGKIDTLVFTITTAQGEKETFLAVETGAYSETFRAQIPFAFVDRLAIGPNGIVEGQLTAGIRNNQVSATGSVTVEGQETKAVISLLAAFVPVVNAWIADADSNGAADRIMVRFQKRIARLPETLEGQWNLGSSPFKGVPGARIAFLPGSDSTVVVADFGATPFAAGLTSIPVGEAPKAKLPADPLFNAQKPLLADSIGPVILKAEKHPANIKAMKAGDPDFNLDTLVITLSEPIKTGGNFKTLLKFHTDCQSYAAARTLTAVNNPTGDGPSGTVYQVILDNAGAAVPAVGNCVYLDAGGNYADVPGNLPHRNGYKLQGIDSDKLIQLFRGYPPVAGLDPNAPGYQVAVQDSRDTEKGGISANPAGQAWVVNWIPPVGFTEADIASTNAIHGQVPRNAKDAGTGGSDPNRIQAMPANLSTVQVVATSPYVANVTIFDNLGNYVAGFRQAFGYQGEMGNNARLVTGGMVSYLWWNMRDHRGQLAGQGVYVWKAVFNFQNGKQEIRYTRTGLTRPAGR